MMSLNLPQTPVVSVKTTDNRGHTPEEIADMCLGRIIHVSNSAAPEIRDQANAFKESLRPLLVYYIKKGIQSDRTTVYNALKNAGHSETAELIRRL
jgi:hypothetical protein